MPNNTLVSASPDQPDDEQQCALGDFWRYRTPDERIAVVKSFEPNLPVPMLAKICWVSPRTIIRSSAYRRLRGIERSKPPRPSKFRGRLRLPMGPRDGRELTNPRDPDA